MGQNPKARVLTVSDFVWPLQVMDLNFLVLC